MRRFAVLAALLSAALACSGPPPELPVEATGDERPALTFTDWTADTELFLELPALVQGERSPCALHLTALADFSALAEGRVSAVLRGEGGQERFTADAPTVPGIFRPEVVPRRAGRYRLSVEVETAKFTATHDLGEIEVFVDEAAARQAAAAEEDDAGLVTFLKEQQWVMPFGTGVSAVRPLQPTLRAYGTLRARADGEAYINAPAAGRVVSLGEFPRVGARVQSSQPLVTVAPRLEAADQASLEFAVTDARLDVRHTERDRKRLESLQREGGVPVRQVLDAIHAEEEARAALAAAVRRLTMHKRVQQTDTGAIEGGLQVRSPLSGTILRVDVAPGMFVEAGAEMFQIADLTRIWLDVHVAEVDVARLGELRGVWFELPGGDRVELDATALVARGGSIDPTTRTLSLLFAVDNADAALPIGAFAEVRLRVGEPVSALSIPRSAVVDDQGATVVYVQADGEHFARRLVRLGLRDGDFVAVEGGLEPGEHIVTRGAYAVHLAAASGQAPAHGHSH